MRYRKKPVEIEAVQWNGSNLSEIQAFTGRPYFHDLDPDERVDDPEATAAVFDILHSTWVLVYTGDYVIKGIRGEFYPCRESVFYETYEKVA